MRKPTIKSQEPSKLDKLKMQNSEDVAIVETEINVIKNVLEQVLGREPLKGDFKKIKRKFRKGVKNRYLLIYKKHRLGYIQRHLPNGTDPANVTFEPLLNKSK